MSHVYLKSENLFEFGPLLIEKNIDEKDSPAIKAVNSDAFRITNNGKYRNHISFHFASELVAEDDEEESDFTPGVFFLEPQTMELAIQEV